VKAGNNELVTFAINASISPPLLADATGANANSTMGSASVNLTAQPLVGLARLLPGIFGIQPNGNAAPAGTPTPSPTPLNVASLSITINTPPPATSPSPSPTPYVTYNASLGSSTLYQQQLGFASQLLPAQLQYQQTSSNLCAVHDNEPLRITYPLAPPIVDLEFTVTCPLFAGYQISNTWVPNEFSVLAAPTFELGVTGSAVVTVWEVCLPQEERRP
jgi:hypothetical protein